MQARSTLLKALLVVASLAVVFVAAGSVMYLQNATPALPAISSVESANPTKPYVVKLHAQWCPVCMVTKGVWFQIEASYSTRANLVVFDFTNQATTDSSRVEAGRLGLGKVFDEIAGETGTILVVDGRTKDVTASIHGGRDFAEYRAAIDAALVR
jgi:hypothetical protein